MTNQEAQELFGWMFHSVYTIKTPFAAGGDCQRSHCERPTAERGAVNILGSVIEYDLCGECKREWHGRNVEYFPAKSAADMGRL